MQRWSQKTASRIIPVIVLVLSVIAPFVPSASEAAAGFSSAYLRLDRMAAATATGGTVCATTTAVAQTEAKLVVTFPTVGATAYTVNSTAANWIVDNTNLPSGSTFFPGLTSGTTAATTATSPANVVTWPISDLTASTQYCLHFTGTSTLTTASTPQNSEQASIETQTSGAAVLNHTDIALANDTDQITVSAVVPPTFIFHLSGGTDNFGGNLDPTAGAGGIKSTAGVTVTVTTNAKGGWIAWAKDSQQGLRSTTAGYTIPTSGTVDGTPSTINGGVEGYVLDTDLTTDASGGCTLGIDAEYNGSGTDKGGTLSGSFQPIASCVIATTGTANGDVITLIERATISGATPAGSDYSDIITVVGAGNF